MSTLKLSKAMTDILTEMCSRVGADMTKLDFDSTEHPWYLTFTWTEEQQNTFRNWLIDYLIANKNSVQELTGRKGHLASSKNNIKRLADEFIFNFGWRATQ